MNQLLNRGSEIHLESGETCQIDKFIGGGGQGEVYEAVLGGKPVAVKWYFPHYLTADDTLRSRLERAIEKGPPSDRFLWPLALVESSKLGGYGYVMPLREHRFRGIVELMTREAEASFRSIARAGLELAESFHHLHSRGLCYRDISFGNVFFDPGSGEVRICDNDNVDVDGEASGILGTPRFIAPEVVRGETMPSIQSDRYSLATLLFYMLMISHPLEGKLEEEIHALDLAAMGRLYGKNPVFIFDPQDDSNRPVAGIHDNAIIYWNIYPEFLRRRFVGAFTEGLRDPADGRILESQWCGAMARLHDSVLKCHRCDAEVFYDPEELRSTRQLRSCWNCEETPALPWRIRFTNASLQTFTGSTVSVLDRDTKLYPHHVDQDETFNYTTPVAEVSQHPVKTHLWGLKNLSGRSWYGQVEEGELREVPPGRSFSLKNGSKINFGRVEAIIRH